MWVQVVEALVFGALIAFPMALMGSGGSILAMPILVYIFERDVPTAAGTSLTIVGTMAVAGAVAHYRAGHVQLPTALLFGGVGAVGANLGARLNPLVPGPVVLLLLALVMLAAAAGVLRSKPRERPSARASPRRWRPSTLARLAITGLGVGVLSGFFGVGGGFLLVPALVFFGEMPIHDAVGTSLCVIALQAVGGLVGYWTLGKVDLALAGLFLVGGVGGLLLGLRLARRLSGARLSRAFASMVIVVALMQGYKSLSALWGE
ncbi:MAG TPA: sulfite exporter TauE/SafE family protein [Chloroflexota bacterium]|nr:sulfite exporter TauE/SafE family protein [Chloroflexota bacterium]